MTPLNVQRRRGSVIFYDADGKYYRLSEEEFNDKFNSSPELDLDDDEEEYRDTVY